MFRELKDKCANGVKEIENIISKIKSASQISCEEENDEGRKLVVCELSIGDDSTRSFYQDRI